MSGVRSTTPLKGWLLALALALPMPLPLLLPLMSSGLTSLEGPYENYYRAELAEYLIAERDKEHRPRGVMLAMSGGSCATVGPHRLSVDGVDMYVAFYNDATLASFHSLVDVLVGGNPDFVVIQDTIFVQAPIPPGIRVLYQDARSFWFDRLVDLARILREREVDLADDESWRCRFTFEREALWPGMVQRVTDSINPYSEQQHADIIDFLNNFSAAGIPVIIVSPPMNDYTAKYRQEVFRATSAIIDSSPPLPDVSLLRQSIPMPTDRFRDPFHLSRDANQPYRDWLNGEIIDVLRVRENR